jgi:hypothetical protein
MSEFDKISIDDLELGCRALDEWQAAEERIRKRNASR